MVNSGVSHCVYTRRQDSSGTLKFLQQNPWLTCPERLWLLQTWFTCSMILELWILSLTNPLFHPPPVAMTTKASLSVSYVQSVHLGGYQLLFSLTCMTAVLFCCQQTTLSRSIISPHSLASSTSPADAWYKNVFVLICPTTWQQEQGEVHAVEITTASTF